MASALSEKRSLSKFLNIQDVQNKSQRAGLATNTCLSKVAMLLKDSCNMHTDTHTRAHAHTEPSEASAFPKKQLHCPTSFHKSWGNFYMSVCIA